MSLALHYWMGDVHHCSGPPSLKCLCVEWDVKLNYTIPYHTIPETCVETWSFSTCVIIPNFVALSQTVWVLKFARKFWPFASRLSRSLKVTETDTASPIDQLPVTSIITMGLSRIVSRVKSDNCKFLPPRVSK